MRLVSLPHRFGRRRSVVRVACELSALAFCPSFPLLKRRSRRLGCNHEFPLPSPNCSRRNAGLQPDLFGRHVLRQVGDDLGAGLLIPWTCSCSFWLNGRIILSPPAPNGIHGNASLLADFWYRHFLRQVAQDLDASFFIPSTSFSWYAYGWFVLPPSSDGPFGNASLLADLRYGHVLCQIGTDPRATSSIPFTSLSMWQGWC